MKNGDSVTPTGDAIPCTCNPRRVDRPCVDYCASVWPLARIAELEAEASEMHAHSFGCSLGHPDGDCSDDLCYVAGLHARIAKLEEAIRGGTGQPWSR